jgi:hypothetical protein
VIGTTHERQPSTESGSDRTSQTTAGQDPNHRNQQVRCNHPDTDRDRIEGAAVGAGQAAVTARGPGSRSLRVASRSNHTVASGGTEQTSATTVVRGDHLSTRLVSSAPTT